MVFTGLVQTIGRAAFNAKTNNLQIWSENDYWSDVAAGDSISVNGCCLTVLGGKFDQQIRTFFVMEETRKLTNLIKIYSPIDGNESKENWTFVNLEKSAKFGDKIGGHLIFGHIDGIGRILEIIDHLDGSRSIWVDLERFHGNSNFYRIYLKGSVAVNGVSLTVAELFPKNCKFPSKFRVALIPFTISHTNLQFIQIGQFVNIEFEQKNEEIQKTNLAVKLDDEYFMKRAIELGEMGRRTAPPNPWVGCVLIDQSGKLLGEGFHRRPGTGHAEVVAIQNAIEAGHSTKGAILYTTLEPCSHFGRTPPCVDLLIQKRIGRVVIGLTDPDPKVNGQGINRLREAGISVAINVLASEVANSLRSYLHHRKTGLPWVVLKMAASLDGKIASSDGISKWITNEESREDAHRRFRATSQAIIIGSKTAEMDNPSLTVRCQLNEDELPKMPIRIVICTGAKQFPPKLGTNLLDISEAPTIICILSENLIGFDKSKSLIDSGIEILRFDNFNGLLLELGQRDVLQVLVEGGASIASACLAKRIVNQFVLYKAPLLMGAKALGWAEKLEENKILPEIERWKLLDIRKLGDDICVEYLSKNEEENGQN